MSETWLAGLLGAVGSTAVTLIAVFIRNQYVRGIQSAATKTLSEMVNNLQLKVAQDSAEIQGLKNTIQLISSDHRKMDQSIDALNTNLGKNNQAIASLEATMKGVQSVLQNIFDGNLKIQQ